MSKLEAVLQNCEEALKQAVRLLIVYCVPFLYLFLLFVYVKLESKSELTLALTDLFDKIKLYDS